MGQSSWTEDRVETCRKLYFEGLSSKQIATELGDISRNGVIGLVHRRGWNKEDGAPIHSPKMYGQTRIRKPRGPSKPKKKRPTMSMPTFSEAIEVVSIPAPALDGSDIPLGQRCSIFELTPTTCRYPYGDPGAEGFFFCGAKTWEGTSYCGGHCRVVFQPARRR